MQKSRSCRALAISLSACWVVSGCASFGAGRLRADQVEYARALGDANKREILSEIVGVRYADPPAVLSLTQIIAAYQFDTGGNGTINAGPGVQAYAPFIGAGNVSYANHPTFTFTPTTGEAYATAYIHPLPTSLLLPLAESAVPIDVLLRLTVQSINGLQNATTLGGPNSNGSPGFFELLAALRRLQIAGVLSIGYAEIVSSSNPASATANAATPTTAITTNKGSPGARGLRPASRANRVNRGKAVADDRADRAKPTKTITATAATAATIPTTAATTKTTTTESASNRSAATTPAVVSLNFEIHVNQTPAVTQDMALVRRLLHLTSSTDTYEVVYGSGTDSDRQVPMMTRSVLGILSDLGAQVEVPEADVRSGAAKPTVALVGGETRPTVMIHSGAKAPPDAFVTIRYRKTMYWVDGNDFDSKYALSIVQAILALAQSNQGNAPPVVTVQAG
jgi:hypothetical protein